MINASLQQSIPLGQQYDLIISTQEEFDAWVSSLSSSSYSGRSVAIVDKGSSYTLSDEIIIPDNCYVIDGFGRPEIFKIYSSSTSTISMISCETDQRKNLRISNIHLFGYFTDIESQFIGFDGCGNLIGCSVTVQYNSEKADNLSMLFSYCHRLVQCVAKIEGGISGLTSSSMFYGFFHCKSLVACNSTVNGIPKSGVSAYGYYMCDCLSACTFGQSEVSTFAVSNPSITRSFSGCTHCGLSNDLGSSSQNNTATVPSGLSINYE